MSRLEARLSILALCLLATACRTDRATQIVGTLERHRLELTAEAPEPVISILVKEGDRVAAGTLLLRLDPAAIKAREAQASAAVIMAEQRLAELVKGPRAQQISEARAALAAAESQLSAQSNEFARIRDLLERKLVSQSALDQARARFDTARGAQRQHIARLDLLLEGTRREEIAQASAALQQAQAVLSEMRLSAGRLSITAPDSGIIEAIPYRLGERPPVGAPVIVMLSDAAPFARVHVPERRRAEFATGTNVTVSVDGLDTGFAGTVRFISAQAAFTPYFALTQEDRANLSYLAEIDLTESAAAGLPTGIPVQVVRRDDGA